MRGGRHVHGKVSLRLVSTVSGEIRQFCALLWHERPRFHQTHTIAYVTKNNRAPTRTKRPLVDKRANGLDGPSGSADNIVPVLLNINQLAKALGVGRTTVENWTRSRRIPCLKIKRVLRYDLQKVLAALAAYERKAIGL
jgi:hypothetical protein